MIKYETDLKRIKIGVLKEIAKLAKNNNLNKDTISNVHNEVIQWDEPQYRDTLEQEKFIITERAKLAAGFAPNGNKGEELVSLRGSSQIIHVIESACDRCQAQKYEVTDACRGCVSRKCMNSCNFKAISRVDGKAYIDPAKCKECGLCAKACPYTAIAEVSRPCKKSCPTAAMTISPDDRRAQIEEEKCINCGACMSACPFGAVTDKSQIADVVTAVNTGKKVYAVVAPAIVGQFGAKVTLGQVKTALSKVGFTDMAEASCGADAVTVHESNEFVERMEEGHKYMTNSCCPGMYRYVEVMFPTEVDKISGTVSPMIATARYIKANNPEAQIAFIGPCTGKKMEVTRKELKDDVQYVLTFEEVAALFEANDVDPETCENISVQDGSLFGRNFAVDGGLVAAITNYVTDKGVDVDFKPISVSGPADIKKAMTMAKSGKSPNNFIEGMMCPGGCVGGPATVNTQMKVRPILNKNSKESEIQNVIGNSRLGKFKDINLALHD